MKMCGSIGIFFRFDWQTPSDPAPGNAILPPVRGDVRIFDPARLLWHPEFIGLSPNPLFIRIFGPIVRPMTKALTFPATLHSASAMLLSLGLILSLL